MEQSAEEVLNKLKELYKNNLEIINILNKIEPSDEHAIYSAWKILSNPRVAEKIDVQILDSIIKNDETSYESICKLVQSIYGQEAEQIIQERPELTMNDIPNFDIFDEQIIDMIGIGGVHTFLTYYMDSADIITELANNPDLIKYYKEFEKITEGYYPPSAIGLEDRLIAFSKHRKIIQEIVDSGLQQEYANELLLLLRDEEGFELLSSISSYATIDGKRITKQHFIPEDDFKTESLEQLRNYKQRRQEILQRYMSSLPEGHYGKRNIVQFKYFGIIQNRPGEYNEYDRKKFLEDYLKFNQTKLTDDEVDLIEICSILEDIQDVELFDRIDELLSQRDDVITPVHMKSINSKVVENYKKEYMESLLTIEDARKMAEDPESKSTRYILKSNGDICFEDYKDCGDGLRRYQDHIMYSNGACSYQYKGKNGNIITKNVRGNLTQYIIDDSINVLLRDGKLFKFSAPGKDEKYIQDFIQTIEQTIEQSELIPQYNPDEFKLEEGDVEGYILYGVHSSQLCVSMIREGIASSGLSFNKLYDKLYQGSQLDRIYIEKFLESGISTRSLYYNFSKGYGGKIGLAFTEMDPNAIVGFNTYDAGTSHQIKQLRAIMGNNCKISDILDPKLEQSIAELATLRYEYDINKIKDGTAGGKVNPDYVVYEETGGQSFREGLEEAKKWAVAFSKPIITFREINRDNRFPEREQKRERKPGELVKRLKEMAENINVEEISKARRIIKGCIERSDDSR